MAGSNESSIVLGNLLFPKIFQTFRMAVQPTKLIITSLALAIICLAGWLMDFSKTVAVSRDSNGKIILTELQVYMSSPTPEEAHIGIKRLWENDQRSGVFSTLWNSAATQFKKAVESVFDRDVIAVVENIHDFFIGIGWAFRYHFIYCIIFFIIELAVLSVAGGAICRIAALQNAQGEKPGMTEAIRYSLKRFTSFFTAPLAPFTIILSLGLFILLLGLLGNIPIAGEIIIGLGMPLALFVGTLIAVVLIGAVAGFNLMFPAVAYDGSDCFDSISRSFSYVYAQPWRMLFYTSIAAVYGSICYTFVRFFAFLAILTTRWFLQVAIWTDNSSQEIDKLTAIWPRPDFMTLLGTKSMATTNWSENTAAFLIYIFLLVVIGLVVSFIISFYFSANTVIYSLMRKKVDNTDPQEIYRPLEEKEIEPIITETKPKKTPPEPEDTEFKQEK